jgi:hypothetical protein
MRRTYAYEEKLSTYFYASSHVPLTQVSHGLAQGKLFIKLTLHNSPSLGKTVHVSLKQYDQTPSTVGSQILFLSLDEVG